jgi:hypothetical protein
VPNYIYKKPEAKDDEYPEKIRQKINFAEKIQTQYYLSEQDLEMIRFEQYKKAFPETLTTFVASLRKVFHVSTDIESQQEEELQQNTEWFVYKLIEEIRDKDNHPHTLERWHGFHTEPVAEIRRNNLDEITDVVVEKERIVYDIPFSRKAVYDVINGKTVVNRPSDICMGKGEDFGLDSQDPVRLPLLSVFNLEEFVQFRYNPLEGANLGGYLVPSYGGVIDFLDRKGISHEDALYPGETIPDINKIAASNRTPTTRFKPSIQEQKKALAQSEYKQTMEQQKNQT